MSFSRIKNKFENLISSQALTSFLKSEKLAGVFFVRSENIGKISDVKSGITPTNEDPYFLFKVKTPANLLSADIGVVSGKAADISLYYSESDEPSFDETRKVILGPANGEIISKTLSFKTDIKWLRVDPVDTLGNFGLIKLSIDASNGQAPENAIIVKNEKTDDFKIDYSVSGNINELKKNIAQNKIIPEKSIVLFSHELTKTGAPLLLRTVSKTLTDFGFHTVVVSFGKGNDYSGFKNSCSQLILIKDKPEEVLNLINELAVLGFKKSITNTVLTGNLTSVLKSNSFKIISLIHEMSASINILNAQNHIKDIAKYSDYVVFPAQCVKKDFLKYCGEIKGECIVRPQGYYKNRFDFQKSDEHRNNLINSMNLPENTIFFICAGSVNFGKGTDLFALIAKKLIEKESIYNKEFHFLWLGSPNDKFYSVWLYNQIEKMSLKDRIHFIDFVSDDSEYLKYLSSCEAFLHTSREDSLPSVILESMAVKLPAATFKESGGAGELLGGGRGYIANYMDIENFCEQVTDILENKEKAKDTAAKSYDYLKESLGFEDYVRFLSEKLLKQEGN